MNNIPTQLPASQNKASHETITSMYYWTDNLLSLRTERPYGYHFIPGQFAKLGIKIGSEIIWRAYSLVSAAQDEELEYFLIESPEGLFTKQLRQMRPGDALLVEKASYGFMTLDRFKNGDDLWMIATGTGIGPFLSILQDPKTWKKFRNLILVHCARYKSELAYQELLTTLPLRQELHIGGAKMHTLRSTTRDEALPKDKQLLQGRITSLLESGDLEKTTGLNMTVDKSRFMICGNPNMVNDARSALHRRGFRPCRRAVPGQFITEGYW